MNKETNKTVVLETQDLVREFQESNGKVLGVLNGLNLQIYSGEMVAITGASGTGKSTLLQILGALDTPTSGAVLFKGESFQSWSLRQIDAYRREKVGFIFQFHHLLPEFTAWENVALPSIFGGGKMNRACRERSLELLEQVGLSNRADHRPGELSGGERQRVAVARALVNRPEVVMADEPSGNLDEGNSEKLHQLFEDLNRKTGQTFLLVTHDEDLARRSHRELVLHEGRAVLRSHI